MEAFYPDSEHRDGAWFGSDREIRVNDSLRVMAFFHMLRWDTQLRYILRKKYWMHIEVREVEKPGRTAAKTQTVY